MRLQEKLNIHDKLNPAIWTEDNKLREDVENKLNEITEYFVNGLEVPIDVIDAHIVGSNASYNYSKHSDLDLHIIANFDNVGAPKEILQAYYNSARASFNKSHDITIRGVNVEVYVEDVKSTTLSNGIYSLFEKRWIKFPKKLTNIPEVDVSRESSKWESKIRKILASGKYDSIKNAINQLYIIRKNSLSVDGEYGKGNQIFKEIRNTGLLDELKDALTKSKSKTLSLESYKKTKLEEASRTNLISKSKASVKGNQRYKRRNKSKVANSVKQFNSIDMNKLFKDNILTVNVSVNGETDDYTVRISFGGFLDILHDELEKTDGVLDLRVITRALLTGFNRDDVYIHCSCPDFCLDGDTKIKLLSGESISVAEMLERFSNGEEMYVYSTDENGDFKPGKVSDVWISGFSDEMTKVTLDNGKEILTTPNHRYMLRDGGYKEARELQVGQSLMPVDFKECRVVGTESVKCDGLPVYDISVDVFNNFCVEAGVMLHNCYRFAYWSTRNDFNSGEPQYDNGKWIRNPDDKLGSACKHTLLVLSNNTWLLKVASVINNYIKYMEKHYQKAYADIIYPAIYGKKYEKDVQLGFDDTDELAGENDTDTLDTANEYGRKRTQFQKGNQQGMQFAKKITDNDEQLTIEDEVQ